MQRNASAAREADAYRPELIADDEPRYLRRQKPVEIRRKKFSGRGWSFYRRGRGFCFGGGCCGGAAGLPVGLLLFFPPPSLSPPPPPQPQPPPPPHTPHH